MCTRTGSSVAELKGQRVTDLRTPGQPHSPGQEQSRYFGRNCTRGGADCAVLTLRLVADVLSEHGSDTPVSASPTTPRAMKAA